MATYGLFAVRRAAVALTSPRLGRFGRVLGTPLRLVASALQRPLNRVLLLGVEVAMEYLLGLTASPYVQWLKVSGHRGSGAGRRIGRRWAAPLLPLGRLHRPLRATFEAFLCLFHQCGCSAQNTEVWDALLGELMAETAAVWTWLMEREVEAPERYSAVQSYRAAMAVLRQQLQYLEVRPRRRGGPRLQGPCDDTLHAVRQVPECSACWLSACIQRREHPSRPAATLLQDLFESGMIDDPERSVMSAPIEAQERALELTGPVWRAPGLKAVLGQLPFLKGQSSAVRGQGLAETLEPLRGWGVGASRVCQPRGRAACGSNPLPAPVPNAGATQRLNLLFTPGAGLFCALWPPGDAAQRRRAAA